jgi:hypothetical protein
MGFLASVLAMRNSRRVPARMENLALLVWKRDRPQKARIQDYDDVSMPESGAAPVGNKASREPDCRIGGSSPESCGVANRSWLRNAAQGGFDQHGPRFK